MDTIVSRLDVTQVFCDVDDFCQQFERHWQHQPQLPSMPGERRSQSRMSLSEVMTIAIAFHGSGFRTFKEFYNLCVLAHWRKTFPGLTQGSWRTRERARACHRWLLELLNQIAAKDVSTLYS